MKALIASDSALYISVTFQTADSAIIATRDGRSADDFKEGVTYSLLYSIRVCISFARPQKNERFFFSASSLEQYTGESESGRILNGNAK